MARDFFKHCPMSVFIISPQVALLLIDSTVMLRVGNRAYFAPFSQSIAKYIKIYQ